MLILLGMQLTLRSVTKCFSKGSIIADSGEQARGLMVITSGQVRCSLPSKTGSKCQSWPSESVHQAISY